MAVTAQQVLDEIRPFIPSTNVLTDAEMLVIIQAIIDQVGDDDSNLAEIKCKSLQAIGLINLSRSTAVSSGIKRQKVDAVEIEYGASGEAAQGWKDYVDSLQDICPLFGYYGLSSKAGIKITTGPKPKINPCCYNKDLEF